MLTPAPLAAACLLAAPAGWAVARLSRPYAADGPKTPMPAAIAITGGLFVWAALVIPQPWLLTLTFALGGWLLTLAAIDLTCFRLPDPFTLPLILAGLATSFLLPGEPFLDHLAGAVIGYATFAILAWAYRAWRRADGIGMGDAKLLAGAGAWLGWRPLPSVILIACGLAFLWVAVLFVRRGREASRMRIAFGAPLCLAIWIVWLQGPLVV